MLKLLNLVPFVSGPNGTKLSNLPRFFVGVSQLEWRSPKGFD